MIAEEIFSPAAVNKANDIIFDRALIAPIKKYSKNCIGSGAVWAL